MGFKQPKMPAAPTLPTAPDPAQVAQTQTGMNRDTAIASQRLNMVNQVTPWGRLSYEQTGTAADGTPTFTATTALSPDQQQALDTRTQLGTKIGQTASAQADRVAAALATPFKLGNDEIEGRLIELGRKRLDPQFKLQREDLESELVNRGLRPGTAGHAALRDQLGRDQNDAMNSLILNGHQQAVSDALAERNQPLRELQGLMGVYPDAEQPQWIGTPRTSVAGTDFAGLTSATYGQQMQAMNADHQNRMDGFKQKNANYQAMLGGLFGLGGSAIRAGTMRPGP